MDKMNNSSSSSISIRTIHTHWKIRIIHERIGIMNDTQRARSILWMGFVFTFDRIWNIFVFMSRILSQMTFCVLFMHAHFIELFILCNGYILYFDGFFSFSFHSGPDLIPIRNKVSMCVVTFSMRWFCFLPFYHWSYSYKLLEIWTWGTLLSSLCQLIGCKRHTVMLVHSIFLVRKISLIGT